MRLRKLPEVAVRASEGIVADATTVPCPPSLPCADEYDVERVGSARPRPWSRGWRTACDGEVGGDDESEDELEFDLSELVMRIASRLTS